MPVYYNGRKSKDLYLNGSKIGLAFYNGNLVYSNQEKTFVAGSNLVPYVVPNGVKKLRIDCVASKGDGGSSWDVKAVGVVYGGSGGGSSYTHPTLCSNVTHTQGYMNGNGYIKITPIN